MTVSLKDLALDHNHLSVSGHRASRFETGAGALLNLRGRALGAVLSLRMGRTQRARWTRPSSQTGPSDS